MKIDGWKIISILFGMLSFKLQHGHGRGHNLGRSCFPRFASIYDSAVLGVENIGHLDCKQVFFVPLFNDVRPSFLEILAYLIPIPTVKQAIVEETKIAL